VMVADTIPMAPMEMRSGMMSAVIIVPGVNSRDSFKNPVLRRGTDQSTFSALLALAASELRAQRDDIPKLTDELKIP
jgi:hypothetical protein